MWKIQLRDLVASRSFLVAASSAMSAAAGAAAGYVVAQKKLKAWYETVMEEERANYKTYYTVKEEEMTLEELAVKNGYVIEETPKIEDPEVAELDTHVTDYTKYAPVSKVEKPADSEEELTTRNIFDRPEFETIKATRDEEKPYVISVDEWNANEHEYAQSRLTYFEKDGVLIDDENDMPIEGEEDVIGENTLALFGVGSKNANGVYVRNEFIKHDYEIIRSFGSYAKEVAGFDDDDELQHSSMPRKFRRYHE